MKQVKPRKKSDQLLEEIAIHPINLVDIDTINLNNWNPNFVSSAINSAIRDDIEKNGYIEPIVLQKHNRKLDKDNVIINGEHRFLIMQKKNQKQISAITLDVPDKTAKALSIRLNREHGELFPDKTSALIHDLSPDLNFEYIKDLLFMDQNEVKMFSEVDVEDISKQVKKNAKNIFVKEVTCPNCQHKFKLD